MKKLIPFIIALVIHPAAFAGSNIMKLSSVSVVAGQPVELELEIINDDEFVAFQFDVPLPLGFGWNQGDIQLNPDRITNHVIQAAILPGTNIFRAISFSMTNDAYLGNSGVIATFTLSTPSTTGYFQLSLWNVIICDSNAVNIKTGSVNGSVTLTGFTITFFVTDINQTPIPDAVIKLGNITNAAGNYIFPNRPPGTHPYVVQKNDHWNSEGEAILVDQDIEINVAMEHAGTFTMQLPDINIPGNTNFWLDLEITNENSFSGFQCDVFLPSGFSYVPGSVALNSARAADHVIDAGMLPGTRLLRITSSSPSLSDFAGDSGAIAGFELAAPPQTGSYTLPINNAVITNASGQNLIPVTQPATVTLTGFTLTFIVQDEDLQAVTNAIIWLNDNPNPVGNYIFHDIVPGEHFYIVVAPGLVPSLDYVTIEDQDVTLTVTLIAPEVVNVMGIQNTSAVAGENFTINLEIMNMSQFVAFHHDIPLPEGFGFVPGSAMLRPSRKVDHEIEAFILPGTQLFRAIASSPGNIPFNGNHGVIASYTFTAPDTCGIFQFNPADAGIINATGQNILTATHHGDVTVNTTGTYTVFFVVKDQDHNPVNGASITLGNTTNPLGNYIFHQVAPGTHHYVVGKGGYEVEQGSVVVLNQNRTVNITLDQISGTQQGVIIFHNATAEAGQNIVMNLEIINYYDIVAFQHDTPLPEGFAYVPESAVTNPERSCWHFFITNVLPGTNILRIICVTLANCGFIGNEGIIASYTFTTPPTPGVYTFGLQDVIIGDIQGQNVLTQAIPGTVTLTSPSTTQTVSFVVQDVNQAPVEGAVISLGDVSNQPGDYIFTQVAPGNYDYTVEKYGYYTYSGTVQVIDQDLTVDVTLSNYGNIMILPHVTSIAGDDVLIELEILNETDFNAFGLDIILPEGIGYVDGSVELNPERKLDHIISAQVLTGTNILRTASFSLYNSFYTGNQGVMASWVFSTSGAPGVYDLIIQNPLMGHPHIWNPVTGWHDGSITLLPFGYSVTFVVLDSTHQAIENAVITLGEITNPEGSYVFHGIAPGTYAYEVSMEGITYFDGEVVVIDHDVTVTLMFDIVIGIREPEHTKIAVYPNPACDILYVLSPAPVELVRLFDFTGRKVYERPLNGETMLQISVGSFPAGMYLLQAVSSGGSPSVIKVGVGK